MRDVKFRVFNKRDKNFDFNKIVIEPKIQTNIVDLTTSDTSEIIFHQFTGLTDKNDKEIYEGDILKIFTSLPYYVLVAFRDGAFNMYDIRKNRVYRQHMAVLQTNCIRPLAILNPAYAKCAEVVGNIFENPELLENAR